MLLLSSPTCVSAEALRGLVVAVQDGDTLTVLDGAKTQHKVRLAGIDAPEKGQPWGQRAKEGLSSLAFRRDVEVEWHKRDRYGRLVGKVLVQGRDVNLAQVSSGLAWHYVEYAKEQSAPDRLLYANAELAARRQGAGLWRDAEPLAPWDYRRSKRQTPRSNITSLRSGQDIRFSNGPRPFPSALHCKPGLAVQAGTLGCTAATELGHLPYPWRAGHLDYPASHDDAVSFDLRDLPRLLVSG